MPENDLSHRALRVRRAQSWKQRLVGLLGTRELPAGEALEIAPCNSVHTVGMRYAIDVVFIDAQHRVIKIARQLRPQRAAVAWRAARVLELAAGQADALGIEVGNLWNAARGRFEAGAIAAAMPGAATRSPRRAMRGASTVEMVVVMPLVLMVLTGIMQLVTMAHAKNQFNYAVMQAARSASIGNATEASIRSGLGRGLMPYMGGGNTPAKVAESFVRAQAEAQVAHIAILSPTQQSFDDFYSDAAAQRLRDEGKTVNDKVIPNLNLAGHTCPNDRTGCAGDPASNASRQTLQDANLLKVRITWGVPDAKQIPMGGAIVTAMMRGLANAGLAEYPQEVRTQLLAGRIPLVATATVRMQSEAIRNDLMAAATPRGGGGTTPGTPGDNPGGGDNTPPYSDDGGGTTGGGTAAGPGDAPPGSTPGNGAPGGTTVGDPPVGTPPDGGATSPGGSTGGATGGNTRPPATGTGGNTRPPTTGTGGNTRPPTTGIGGGTRPPTTGTGGTRPPTTGGGTTPPSTGGTPPTPPTTGASGPVATTPPVKCPQASTPDSWIGRQADNAGRSAFKLVLGEQAGNESWNFVRGVLDGLGSQITGLADLVTDLFKLATDAEARKQVVDGVRKLASELLRDPMGTIRALGGRVADGINQQYQVLKTCGGYAIGHFVGENMNIPAARFLVMARRLGRYGEDVADAANAIRRGCSSFEAGTPILTPKGFLPIEQIRVGQLVLSRNETSFADAPQAVAKTMGRTAPNYQRLITEFDELHVTGEHPFWAQARGWVEAKDLKRGDIIVTATGDETVIANDLVDAPLQVFNFSVANTPSYFAGEGRAWVHNADACDIAHRLPHVTTEVQIVNGRAPDLNRPRPNTTYNVNGAVRRQNVFEVDELGRTTRAQATITMDTLDSTLRNCYRQRQAGGVCRLRADDGGHLIGHQLGGVGESVNLVAQFSGLNRGRWLQMENMLADIAASGRTVTMNVEAVYSGTGGRPTQFIVTYSINGGPPTRLPPFLNQ